jgi:hypothetical protein
MKFKLDGNFGTRTQGLFRTLGHDVLTVRNSRGGRCLLHCFTEQLRIRNLIGPGLAVCNQLVR